MKSDFTSIYLQKWRKAFLLFFCCLLMYVHKGAAQCWRQVEAGVGHTVAIRDDGTLWAWGLNTSGQLGIGNTNNQSGAVQVGTANNWATVSAGNNFTIAIKTDGTLWAWGINANGQLGIGSNINATTPVQVGTDNNWAKVMTTAHAAFAAAIKTDGTLWMWGTNTGGQLGLGHTNAQNIPAQVGTDADWLTVSTGMEFTAALKTNGTLWVWGVNRNGQFGDGSTSTTAQPNPAQVGTDNDWSAVTTGQAFVLALKISGALWAWGINFNGQLGIGSSGLGNQRTSPLQVGSDADWVAVSAGATFSMARKTDGSLWGWGVNSSGQLGTGNTTLRNTPGRIGTANDWAIVRTGGSYTLALKTDKTLWGTGLNTNSQLGIGNTTNQNILVRSGMTQLPSYLPGLGGGSATLSLPSLCDRTDARGYWSFVHPAMDARKLVAIHPNGNTGNFTVVYDTSRNTNSTPLVQSDASNATSLMGRLVTVTYSGTLAGGVRARLYYSQTDSINTCRALDAWMGVHPGAVRKWQWVKYEGDATAMATNQSATGFNGSYAVLTPDSVGKENGISFVEFWNLTSFSTFGAIASATAGNANDPLAQCWKQVSAGFNFALGLKDDGTLWAWGSRASGQLGTGSAFPGSEPVPIPVGTGTDWAYISAGTNYALGVKSDGSLWAWGANSSGQLGIGTTTLQTSPVRVGMANNWARAVASGDGGGEFSIGLKTDGTLWAWGRNDQGQLGIGNTTNQLSPVQVGSDADWATVAADFLHVLAVKTNGTLWAWGENNQGQLGIGSTTNQTSPVQVGTDADWASVNIGQRFSVAIKNNGTLWAWGFGADGRLGIGNTTDQTIPVQVGTDFDWASVASGNNYTIGIKTNGTLWSWGYNGNGQLGDGTYTSKNTPVQIGTDNDWTAVSADYASSFALKANKSLWGWGANTSSMLGIANSIDQSSPVSTGSSNYAAHLPGLGGGTAVLFPSCNADIHGYYAYRNPVASWQKQFAIHPQGNTVSFSVTYDTSRNTNNSPLIKSNATAASSLIGRLVTVTYSGTIGTGVRVRYYYSKADSTSAMNALVTIRPDAVFQLKWIKFEGDAATMVSSQTATGFSGSYTELTPDSSGVENGVPFVEFRNVTSFSTFGSLVTATFPSTNPMVQCWKQAAGGDNHTVAIKEDGTLWAWGDNTSGQLGIGNTTSQAVPVPVGLDNDWAFVAAGGATTFAIKTNGTLWAWGRNAQGQLGIGNTVQQNSPVQVGTIANWSSVSAHRTFTTAMRTDGTLWGWGQNSGGELGLGHTVGPQLNPVQIGTDADWASMAAGNNHTLAIKTDGTLWSWGVNTYGQLGTGNKVNQTSPVQVGTESSWASVAAGIAFSAALKTNGTLWTWGHNFLGQLGSGNNVDRISPGQAGTASDWESLMAKGSHILALKTNGTLWACGENTSGQLGDGSNTHRNVLAQIGTATDWVSIAPSVYHNIAIRSDKTMWVCGYNNTSQLGIGNTTNQNTFVQSGSNNYAAYLPSLGGGASVTLITPCTSIDIRGYYNFVNPADKSRRLFAIHPMGNTGMIAVTYDSSRNTNSSPLLHSDAAAITSLMGRLVTVTYPGTIASGMRVRFYYSSADSTNASNALDSWINTHPGAIKQWQWIKYEGDAAAMAANQTANGFSGAFMKLTPDSSGIENGVSFVEFWNINSFSTFGAVAFANVYNAPLPVTLNDFTATLQRNCTAVQLNWSTSSEQNSRDFTVQRSTNGVNWSNIGAIPAAGNSDFLRKYNYTDNAVGVQTTYFYRLQMNDVDGMHKYSKVLTVQFNCGGGSYLVYPNPVNDVLIIQTPVGGHQQRLAVYNAMGQRIEQLMLNAGSVQTINTSPWGKGLYMLVITEAGKTVQVKRLTKL